LCNLQLAFNEVNEKEINQYVFMYVRMYTCSFFLSFFC
jgi:hypothetical protein